MKFKKRLQKFFYKPSQSLTAWNAFIYLLIFASIAQLLSEYGWYDLGFSLREHLIIDISIASIFLLDYLARIYTAPKRAKFFFNTFNLIDLIAILPSFLGLLQFEAVRSLRGLRVLRKLKLLRVLRLTKGLKNSHIHY